MLDSVYHIELKLLNVKYLDFMGVMRQSACPLVSSLTERQ